LDALLALVRSVRRRYESALAVAEGEFVMVHGRFSGGGRRTMIVVDIPMFGNRFLMRDVATLAVSRVNCASRPQANGRDSFSVEGLA
jgi:hypothetical protein